MSTSGDRPQSAPAQKKRKKKKARPWYRTAVQIFFFVLVAAITFNQALAEYWGRSLPFLASASLHAICPFGGVVSAYDFVTSGRYTQKIHSSSWILMWAGFILAIGFGPLICGWVCPLGTFQQWMAQVGRKLFGKKFNHMIPANIDKPLRYVRYLVLAVVIYLTAASSKLIFQDYDPYFALFNFWSPEVASSALLILAVTVAASLLMERPWCKYLCPYGAVLGLFNLIRIFPIRREAATCIDCKLCDRNCPMNITVSTASAVRDHQCISCMNCTSEQFCPVADTVDFTTQRGPARPPSGVAAIKEEVSK